MTADIAWLMIVANAVIAAIAIGNSWALAWYAKRPKKKQTKRKNQDELDQLGTRPSIRRAAPYGLNVILSVVSLAYSFLHPNPDLNIQILQIALSVGLAVLALALALIGPLVESSSEQLHALLRVVELTTKLAEAMPRKSPNPTAEAHARDDSARGSP